MGCRAEAKAEKTRPDAQKEAEAGPRIRPSKSGRRRAAVLIGVHALVAIHVAHWLSSGSSISPLEPSEAMEFAKHGIVNAGLIFFGLTILSTLFLGRWFCGWACHVVALQDLCLWLLKKLGIKPRPLRSRLLAFVPAFAALYMFAYPFIANWKAVVGSSTSVVLTKQDFWGTFPPWPVAVATFLVCGFAIVYFLGAKGFCTYACPYGAIFGLADRFAVGRIRVTDACEGCAHCTATCTSNVLVHEEVRLHGMVVDPGCMKCMDCVSVCPKNALYFGFGAPALRTPPAQRSKATYTWREELLLGGSFLVGFFVFRDLYGVIPFLLGLGIAGILSICFFNLVRTWTRAELVFCGRRLKSGGKLTRSGTAFVLAMSLVAALTVHSALIQFHSRSSAREFAATEELQFASLLDPGRRPTPAELTRVERGLSSARFVERFGLASTRQNRIELAWFHLLDGEPAEFERYLKGMAGSPKARHLQLDLGQFYEARGQIDEAIAAFEASLEPETSLAVFDRLARLLLQAGRTEEALDVYRRAVRWRPNTPELYDRLAQLLLMARRPEETIDVYREGVRRNPNNPDLVFNLGVSQLALAHVDDAIASFQRVLELDPGRMDAQENLAQLRALER